MCGASCGAACASRDQTLMRQLLHIKLRSLFFRVFAKRRWEGRRFAGADSAVMCDTIRVKSRDPPPFSCILLLFSSSSWADFSRVSHVGFPVEHSLPPDRCITAALGGLIISGILVLHNGEEAWRCHSLHIYILATCLLWNVAIEHRILSMCNRPADKSPRWSLCRRRRADLSSERKASGSTAACCLDNTLFAGKKAEAQFLE